MQNQSIPRGKRSNKRNSSNKKSVLKSNLTDQAAQKNKSTNRRKSNARAAREKRLANKAEKQSKSSEEAIAESEMEDCSPLKQLLIDKADNEEYFAWRLPDELVRGEFSKYLMENMKSCDNHSEEANVTEADFEFYTIIKVTKKLSEEQNGTHDKHLHSVKESNEAGNTPNKNNTHLDFHVNKSNFRASSRNENISQVHRKDHSDINPNNASVTQNQKISDSEMIKDKVLTSNKSDASSTKSTSGFKNITNYATTALHDSKNKSVMQNQHGQRHKRDTAEKKPITKFITLQHGNQTDKCGNNIESPCR